MVCDVCLLDCSKSIERESTSAASSHDHFSLSRHYIAHWLEIDTYNILCVSSGETNIIYCFQNVLNQMGRRCRSLSTRKYSKIAAAAAACAIKLAAATAYMYLYRKQCSISPRCGKGERKIWILYGARRPIRGFTLNGINKLRFDADMCIYYLLLRYTQRATLRYRGIREYRIDSAGARRRVRIVTLCCIS